MLSAFAARPTLWFGTLSLPALCLGSTCLMALLIPGVAGVVLPTLAFLCFSLAGHFLVMGILGEMVLKTGDFIPGRMMVVRGIEVREQ